MNLDQLRSAQVDERGSSELQPLPDSFYADVAEYLDELRLARERAADQVADPFDSDTVRRLTDEIEAAEEVVEAIYERRVGKVVKRASLAAAGMPADDAGLTEEEAALFDRLVGAIERNRRTVLAAIAGETKSPDEAPTDPPAEADADVERGGATAEAPTTPPPPPEAAPADPQAETDPDPPRTRSGDEAADGTPDDTPADSDPERVTLRITRDVGEVFGVDERVYQLAAEDVVTLPSANAKPLLDREAATRLD